MEEILAQITSTIDVDLSTPQEVASPLIMLSKLKKGLSAREVTKSIIGRKPETGAPVGALPDGSDSVEEKMLYLMMQVLIEHFITNAKITVVIPPGVPVFGTGVGADGVPVTINGVTTDFAKGYAIIQ